MSCLLDSEKKEMKISITNNWTYLLFSKARVSGDPHFVTFDGHAYTFNPAGEFGALSNGNLSLQLRMEQIGSSQGILIL